MKPQKKKSLGINLEALFKKKPNFLKKDKDVIDAEAGAGNGNDEDDNTAPSEATVIIEDEPPRKVC